MKSLSRYVVAILVLVVVAVAGFWGLKFLLALVLGSLTATIKFYLIVAVVGIVALAVVAKTGIRRFSKR